MSWGLLYSGSGGVVTWSGHDVCDESVFGIFLQGPVAERLEDKDGSEALSEHLRGLSLTGMGMDALQSVLDAELPETRDWAAGEALAEALLQDQHDVVLPWNNERDKRNPFASLPGADVVGFQRQGSSYRLALGEVKCSSEEKWPPQVMSGRSGMIHQLETLASHLGTLCQLLKWLLPRVKNTEYQPAFDAACRRYFESGNRDLALFGVLIRDQSANEMDLKNRGKALAKCVHAPTDCHLIALYLPWPIKQLPAVITQGDAT